MGCYCYIIEIKAKLLDDHLKQIKEFEKLICERKELESSEHMITNLYSITEFNFFKAIWEDKDKDKVKVTSYTSDEEIRRLAVKFKKDMYLKFVHGSKYYYLSEKRIHQNGTFSLLNFSNYTEEFFLRRIIKMSNTLYIFCIVNDIQFEIDKNFRDILEDHAFKILCHPKFKSIEKTVNDLILVYNDLVKHQAFYKIIKTTLKILIMYFKKKFNLSNSYKIC